MQTSFMHTLLDAIDAHENVEIARESYFPQIINNGPGFIMNTGHSSVHPVLFQGSPAMLKIPGYPEDELGYNSAIIDFKRERRAYSLNSAMHVAFVYSSGEIEHPIRSFGLVPYLIMKRYETSLDDRLPKLSLDEAFHFSYDLALAISEVHASGLVHRDISPSNCLIFSKKLFLSDFGIAEIHDEMKVHEPLGKPAYGAPEQYQGRILKKSDIWAWGVVYLNMLLKMPEKSMSASEKILPSVNCFYPVTNSDSEVPVTKKFGGVDRFRDIIKSRQKAEKRLEKILDASIDLLQQVFRPIEERADISTVINNLSQMRTYFGL